MGLIEGDALLTLAKLPDACVDAIVTDPPYGISLGARVGTESTSVARSLSAAGI